MILDRRIDQKFLGSSSRLIINSIVRFMASIYSPLCTIFTVIQKCIPDFNGIIKKEKETTYAIKSQKKKKKYHILYLSTELQGEG
jgi:hypothetical protein